MPKNIFKAINPSFITPYFLKKKNSFFPECREKEIEKVEIKQVSPSWAKTTCLARYKITFNDRSQKIIRGTAKADYGKEDVWRTMNYLYTNLSQSRELLIPQPLDYLKEIHLLLYEEAPGTPLVSILQKKDRKMKEKAIKKAAVWLSWLHNLSPGRKRLPKAVFIGSEGYKKTLTKIEKYLPELKKILPLKKDINFVDNIWVPGNKIIHNDFYPGNSIVGDKSFFGIDFDRSGLGPPLMDVAALFSFFDFSKRMWPYKMPQGLKESFLKEYCSINRLNFDKTAEEIHPFLVKSFFDQLHYYTNFFIKGRHFMDEKTKKSFSLIIRDILIIIKNIKNE